DRLIFTSCMAPNMDGLGQAIARYVGDRLSMATTFVNDIPWPEREARLDVGEIHVGWICGLPYVWKADQPTATVSLLAAPVMAGDRYQGRPVYFSDVVVQRDRPYQSVADLRGCSWAYNEPRSHSGYYVTRAYLASQGYGSGFFGQAVESGAHQRSLQLILSGDIDASAIDSTVLEVELQRDPSIAEQIRVIGTFGPSPMPPWVVSNQLPSALVSDLRSLFLTLHTDPHGRALLAQWNMSRFVEVGDRDYDPIRHMAKQAETVKL
ncbi:MAG TPA: PhnD/SsuA/transferrin family substrate-binding protein, partial [Chroococcidiopsis sp.]